MKDKTTEIVIDFAKIIGSETNLQEDSLDLEQSQTKFGNDVKQILQRMFGMSNMPVSVQGTREQISSFSKVLAQEKQYIESARNLGLEDPRTVMKKSKVEQAANEFRRNTGVEWPFQ